MTTTDYTDSAACQMLASHCSCCGRPLVDADSVQSGIGPTCRAKHGFAVPCAEPQWELASVLLDQALESGAVLSDGVPQALVGQDARKACNGLVYSAACVQGTPKVHAIAAIIHALGYRRLAERVSENAGAIRVELGEHEAFGTCLKVRTPYSPSFNEALRTHKAWQRWSKADKARYVHPKSRKALWAALSDAFPGSAVIGPKGIKELPKSA